MPVHTPGPKLYDSIPFHHLAQVKGGGGKAVNVALNVTPFVDMMTILVTFLLMVFSATGELLSAQRGLTLPDATNKDQLKRAPLIVVTGDAITYGGQFVANPVDVHEDTSMEWKIIELYDRLRAERAEFHKPGGGFDQLKGAEKDYCTSPEKAMQSKLCKANPGLCVCLDGLLILQADKDMSAKVLNRIVKTAYAAEYPNIMFAVNRRNTRGH